MKIFYRISPKKPDNEAVCFPDDKWKLVTFSHNSFLKAGGDKYDTTYVLDDCSDDWADYFKKYGKVERINEKKKYPSLKHTLEMARKEEGKLLFLEDDYLWRPNTIGKMEYALNFLPVLSPYDHPAHYSEARFATFPFKLKLIDNNVYRTCPSNTHSFGLTAKTLNDNWNCFVNSLGKIISDHTSFSLLNKTAQLWCPTYSFATHLAQHCIAPNVDWNIPSS